MPLPGLPYPDMSPFHNPGDESKFSQNVSVVDGSDLAPSGMPPFANGSDVRKNYVAPKSGAPGPESQ